MELRDFRRSKLNYDQLRFTVFLLFLKNDKNMEKCINISLARKFCRNINRISKHNSWIQLLNKKRQ